MYLCVVYGLSFDTPKLSRWIMRSVVFFLLPLFTTTPLVIAFKAIVFNKYQDYMSDAQVRVFQFCYRAVFRTNTLTIPLAGEGWNREKGEKANEGNGTKEKEEKHRRKKWGCCCPIESRRGWIRDGLH